MTAAAVNYDHALNVLRGDNVDERLALASNPHTPPEILFYLADDQDVGVRRAVAGNAATPNKADAILSKDNDVSVRCEVARKIVGDGLDGDARRDMWRMGFTILETLMRDSVVKVRRILTEALRSDPQAPHQVIAGLARDREETVAAPILSDSPVLTDDDLKSIVLEGHAEWVDQAVAGRDSLSPELADVLVENADAPAVARVIANPAASLSASALEGLVDRAATAPELQPPLVGRRDMSGKLLTKLARFVPQPLLKTLCGRKDLDQKSVQSINKAIDSRDDKPGVRAAPTGKAAAAEASLDPDSPEARARRLFETGELTDEAVAAALERWDSNFVIEALALRAGYSPKKVRRMVRVKSARTIVALAWKAKFSARFAMDLQRQLANILPTKIVNARDGVDFALTQSEMEAQLSLFD